MDSSNKGLLVLLFTIEAVSRDELTRIFCENLIFGALCKKKIVVNQSIMLHVDQFQLGKTRTGLVDRL